MRLDFSAISDVGRVRKDNQDSGYVGPHVVAVCDGVGGAARGDIASSTAIAQLRKLEETPPGEGTSESDLLGLVSNALHRAQDRIAELVDENPSLDGTSTTATVALFDGERVGMGHVGDSRAYLFRHGEISQLTNDHTFVQTLIDEGRITEADARVHPHPNLILTAIDGKHDHEPDQLVLELTVGDRLLLCSDGASGVLDAGRLADILSSGTPDYAAVELVRASLEAGSSDNVTCVVADVITAEQAADDDRLVVAGRTTLDHVGDQAGDVVGAARLEAGAHQLDGREVRAAGAQDVREPAVLEDPARAVAAEQQPVARGELDDEQVRLGLVDAVERPEDEVAVRVDPRLLLGDPALVDQALHEGVVLGELAEHAVAQEVSPAVADVADGEPAAVEERGRHRGRGAVELRVVVDELGEPVVGAVDGTGQRLVGVLGGGRVETPEDLHRRTAGDVAACGATDAVGDHQQVRAGEP